MKPASPAIVWRWYGWSELSADLLYAILRLRSEVFVVEQTCAFQDLDGLDALGQHLCGTDPQGALLAYARLLPPGVKSDAPSIGRVVTAPAVRGTGLGRALMREALAGCVVRHPDLSIHIGAQQRLEHFYAGLGFVRFDAPYLEDGIWHVQMLRGATPV